MAGGSPERDEARRGPTASAERLLWSRCRNSANRPEGPTLALVHRLSHFLTERISVGDRLGEAFYAVWMAVISIGLVNSSAGITPEHVGTVVGIAFSVNLTWGIIDGITAMYTYIIERADRDRIVDDLARGYDPAAARARGREALDDTIAAALSDAEKDRILDAIAQGAPAARPQTRRYRADKDDWLFALGIVAIDVGLVVPVVLPLVLISDIAAGVYVSRLVATVLFAAIGWGYAKNLNRNPWLAAAFLGLLGFALFTYAYETGG